jgi:hypothetical protein
MTEGRDPSRQSEREPVVKASFNLPESELNALKRLADRRSTSATQVLRQAIESELFIQELAEHGAKVLVQDSDKTIRQVVFSQTQTAAARSAQMAGAS